MISKLLTIAAGVTMTVLSLTSVSEAATGFATASVNMRACPSSGCDRILVVPAGASVEIYYCDKWCQIGYGRHVGYAYGQYIAIPGHSKPPEFVRRLPRVPPGVDGRPTNRLPRGPAPPGYD